MSGVASGPGSIGTGMTVSNLSFSYGPKRVFRDVSFKIPDKQVWALMGRSGVGKTTLLNVVLGLYQAETGAVEIERGKIAAPGLIRGVVSSESSLLWWLTILENVLFPHHEKPTRDAVRRAKELLTIAGLGDNFGDHPKELSTGMRRRAEIIRAFLIDGDYFVADEPFTALDVQSRLALYDVWRKLRQSNPRTGLICTHDPVEAAVLCDVVLIMRPDGEDRTTIEVLEVPDRFHSGEAASAVFSDTFLATLITAIR